MLFDGGSIIISSNVEYSYADAYASGYENDYDDWRLPTQAESEAIIGFVVEMAIENEQMFTGSVPPGKTDAYETPFWTSTEVSGGAHVTVTWDGIIPQDGELDDREQADAFAVRTQLWED